jgi:hypothetical protein
MLPPRTRFLFLTAALLATAACDTGDTPAPDEPLDSAVGEAPDVEPFAPEPGDLIPINQSGVRGRATLSAEGDGGRAEVEGEGLEPGESYTAHVHEGRCADGGPVRLPLGRMTASTEGTGSLRTRVDADRLPAGATLFIQVHAADDTPVACADIEREG